MALIIYKKQRQILDFIKQFIPMDEANVDFQQYQKWLSEGNQPLPADEPNA